MDESLSMGPVFTRHRGRGPQLSRFWHESSLVAALGVVFAFLPSTQATYLHAVPCKYLGLTWTTALKKVSQLKSTSIICLEMFRIHINLSFLHISCILLVGRYTRESVGPVGECFTFAFVPSTEPRMRPSRWRRPNRDVLSCRTLSAAGV